MRVLSPSSILILKLKFANFLLAGVRSPSLLLSVTHQVPWFKEIVKVLSNRFRLLEMRDLLTAIGSAQ